MPANREAFDIEQRSRSKIAEGELSRFIFSHSHLTVIGLSPRRNVAAVGLGRFAGTLAIAIDTAGFCGRFVNTFVRDAGDGDDSDKVHPHFYCSAAELVTLLAGFELVSLRDLAQKKPSHIHWQFVAERLG